MPPGVLHIPWRERLDFAWHVSLRYARQIATHWPVAIVRALRHPYPEAVTDDGVASILYDTSMAKLLCPTLDPPDEVRFAEVMRRSPGARWAKTDFSAYEGLQCCEGMYAAATVSLFQFGDDGRPHLRAIAIGGRTLTPADGEAWELAKLFVLQGAGHHMVNCHHIPLHFPLDTVNAVTKSVLPPAHPVAALFAPHFRFSLSLDEAALYSQFSVLRNRELFIYSPFALEESSVYRLTRIGYAGLPGNSAYPTWRFSPKPEPVLGDFGTFLNRYYDAMLAFTREVVAELPADDAALAQWADTIAGFLPGFPDSTAIRRDDMLPRVLAKIMWSATVAHGADHYDYGRIPIGKIPMRLRVPPPGVGDAPNAKHVKRGRWSDAMRHEMARVLFFKEETLTRLIDVRHDFASPSLTAASRRFVASLHAVDAALTVRRFIPLDQIPASIQY